LARTLDAGRWAEDRALEHLEACGLEVLARNYRCRFGELDLVMTHGTTLVFVEVRYRRNDRFGRAADTVTPAKQRRLQYAARHFLARFPAGRLPACRFDVVSVSRPNYAPEILWIRDAFTADG
jgi:putative endonuclease